MAEVTSRFARRTATFGLRFSIPKFRWSTRKKLNIEPDKVRVVAGQAEGV